MTDPLNPIQPDETKYEPLTPADRPKSQWRRWHIPVLVFLAIASYLIVTKQNKVPYQTAEGAIFGTFYHLTYQSRDDLQAGVEAELLRVDSSLSMFNPSSIISRVNRDEDVEVDSLFRTVFTLAQQVSAATGGAFDITVAPLVNAWGFGFKNGALPDSAQVDSLRQLVGYQHIRLLDNNHIEKDTPGIVLDCSAVAKGFSGVNPKGKPWRVGVNKAADDPTSTNQELATVLNLTDRAMATSGNYRNYYTTDDGRRVAHTIDPSSGYPVQHSLLSATVLAPTCAEADAFATSFMVMGIDSARTILTRRPELQVFFIYDSLGTNLTFSTIREES